MNVHDETMLTALGETETPMQRLERERDEARAERDALREQLIRIASEALNAARRAER